MNLNDSPDQARFRAEVRDWIKNSVPAEFKALRQGIVQAPELTEEEKRPLIEALAENVWLAPHWPKEYGGAGFDLAQSIIFNEECGKAGVPIHRSNGINMLGPILIRYGTAVRQGVLWSSPARTARHRKGTGPGWVQTDAAWITEVPLGGSGEKTRWCVTV